MELRERGTRPSAPRPRGRGDHGTERCVVASTHERGPRSRCLIACGLPEHTGYDNVGNIITAKTSSGTTTYTYDYHNRLTNVDINGTMSATYTYDALGRRIGIDDSGTQTWTAYNGKTADDNPYADFTSAGALKIRYVDGLAVDEVMARTDSSGNVEWYLTNQLGSVVELASTTSGALDKIVYDPYGNVVTQTNATNADRFMFAGMEYDSVTGLYYDHARYYNSVTGRFVSQDPKGFKAGDTNLYRYVQNQPTCVTDTSGYGLSGRMTPPEPPQPPKNNEPPEGSLFPDGNWYNQYNLGNGYAWFIWNPNVPNQNGGQGAYRPGVPPNVTRPEPQWWYAMDTWMDWWPDPKKPQPNPDRPLIPYDPRNPKRNLAEEGYRLK